MPKWVPRNLRFKTLKVDKRTTTTKNKPISSQDHAAKAAAKDSIFSEPTCFIIEIVVGMGLTIVGSLPSAWTEI